MPKPTRCERCGRENDVALAFCLDCGQPLRAAAPPPLEAARCAACGAALQPGFRFCGTCGAPAGGRPATPGHVPPPPPRAAPAPGAEAVPPSARTARIRIALVRSDGVPGRSFPVEGEAICGRTEGEIRLADDATVSPRHARFDTAGGVLRVEDLGSVNGTFLRLREPRVLALGEELRIGRQLLRLEPLPRPAQGDDRGMRPWGTRDPGYRFRLAQLLEDGGLGEIFPLREGENVLGRDAGEITFPGDRYVSARHARLQVTSAAVRIADANSSNGTFAKIGRAAELSPGDQLLVGAQLLRVDEG